MARPQQKEARQPRDLIGGRTSEEVLWSCTTCGACQEVCPVFIDHPGKILEMRRNSGAAARKGAR